MKCEPIEEQEAAAAAAAVAFPLEMCVHIVCCCLTLNN